MNQSRTDERGRAFKKSQLQTQLYVNRRQDELTAAVLDALPTLSSLSPPLEWVSPLEAQSFAEFHDADFVKAIGRPDLESALNEFWPRGGPHWDALAIARGSDGENLGPVLVEGKSWPGEMRSKLAATEPSRTRIIKRLAETRARLGVGDEHADAWRDRYYQAANRYAYLSWFCDALGERAWLANIYFVNDPAEPTSRKEWEEALAEAEEELGLARVNVPHAGRVFLPAGTRAELLAPRSA